MCCSGIRPVVENCPDVWWKCPGKSLETFPKKQNGNVLENLLERLQFFGETLPGDVADKDKTGNQ